MSGFITNSLTEPQGFATKKHQNNGLALYTLSLRKPGFSLLSLFTYTFPISPQGLRKMPVSMSNIYDTSGPPSMSGVMRTVDSWGIAPPMFFIDGTTGYDYHQTDGYIFTGQQSIVQLQYILQLYAQLNQSLKLQNNPNLYSLELYDYWNQDFWQVEPIGEIEIRATDRAPTLLYYRLRLAGVRPVNAPIISDPFADQVKQAFYGASSNILAAGVQTLTNSILGIY